MVKNKKKRKEFELWANKSLKKIQDKLLLTHFELRPIKPSRQNDINLAYCRYPYKDIYIEYAESTLTSYIEGDKQYCTGILVHEMLHSAIDPLYQKAKQRFTTDKDLTDEMESLTDHITNIIMKNDIV